MPVPVDNPTMEAIVIEAGATLQAEDGAYRWYKQKSYKPSTDSELGSILNQLDCCNLECDGMTRIISYILNRSGVNHRAMAGSIRDRVTNKIIQPHLWIVIEDETNIDYRAKMWLGDREDIPHGVFEPREWSRVEYCGQALETSELNDSISHILAVVNGVPIDKIVDDIKGLNK
ncbi:hypothetical protein [Paenibacillus glucanolyticus]|nr:hypothetical protein [Paenibacillus glucanolyticus]